ncbi:SDR family oxidoreductase [Brachybacterium huguangmaarense]|uniref:SDR family oxidoreductase n=1 Tax=Brachybacterium huguangmaarense TaxID=1652028 RepID=A0ABY6G2M5_9MICO|nr:SDR family oxidoreductase [Brachybacterium huguangmaarense]UYG17465.1 SDR family oxidoreductase [Brachybacterium huguangmaarense]
MSTPPEEALADRTLSADVAPSLDAPSNGAAVRVLVTGASGYVGGRLVPVLLDAGARVRVCGRHRAALEAREWSERTEVVEADLADRMSVRRAVDGIDVVVFLVHAMGGGAGYADREARMARIMAEEAERAGVSRLVYLSGLHPETDDLSEHMASRERVAEILREGGVPTLVVQAATVIGAGSASFEIIRHLAERLPVMPAPSWVANRIEPVAIADALHYLKEAALASGELEGTYEISSGESELRFMDLLTQYAEVAGLSARHVIPLPIPAPLLSGFWIGMVTPVPLSIAVPLAQSMKDEAVAHGHALDEVVPPPPGGPTPYREAVREALVQQKSGDLATTWDGDVAMAQGPEAALPEDPDWAGHTVYTDERTRTEDGIDPAAVWEVIEGIGGTSGWYSTPLLWRLRGVMDRLLGGYGLRRGRRDAAHLRVGDAVDWWRVEAIEPGRRLTLRAEMRMTGRAWLQLGVTEDDGSTTYHQRAVYFPDGLIGRLYWWGIYPFHALVFPSMARHIMAEARTRSTTRG